MSNMNFEEITLKLHDIIKRNYLAIDKNLPLKFFRQFFFPSLEYGYKFLK
ncbi:MAG: hypothetical protein LBJ32_03920 [Oscillospiraceae bacterium]|nr:hypothetical protein [Oscillospiraceae bacterium]